MGYRNYIGRISKENYFKIKDFHKEELYEIKGEDPEDGWVSVHDLVDTELYELGKYVDEFERGFLKPFFNRPELQKVYAEGNDLFVGNKEFFKCIIDSYREKIKSYYSEMLKPFYKSEKKRWLDCDFIATAVRGYDDETFKNTFTFDLEKITKEQQTGIYNALQHVRSMSLEWDNEPYNLDRGDAVTTSWKYEYVQFELIRLYKNFDWENDLLIYYGS